MKITRPAVRWFGGKWQIATWIIEHLPRHRVYVEPFCGGASVLMRKDRSYAEVINDRDESIVELFSVLRDPVQSVELQRRLEMTPFSRVEFEKAYEPAETAVERARQLLVRSFMGFGANAHNTDYTTGFRANSNRSGSTPASDWGRYPQHVSTFCDRLKGVTIECRPAIEVIEAQDSPDTLFYLDPPYLHQTRSRIGRTRKGPKHSYNFEMAETDHVQLIEVLLAASGMVVLSAYESEIYNRALSGWKSVRRESFADGARPRTEILWLNPTAVARLEEDELRLTGAA